MEISDIIERVSQVYRDKLLREPDTVGLDHYVNEIRSGRISLESLPTLFESSEEFKKLDDLRRGYILTTEGFKIYLDQDDQVVSRSITISKSWEPFETKLIKDTVKKGMIALDLGANIGYFTIALSNCVEEGRVYSFEPNPFSFAFLQKNIQENKLANVIATPKAISNYSGKGKLYLSKTNHGDNRIWGSSIYDADFDREIINVDITTLDDSFMNVPVDFIKCDIQGSEFNMIEGGKEVISKNKNLKMILEFWPIGLKAQKTDPIDFLDALVNMDL